MVEKSTVCFLIHRPSGAEPQNVKEYIEQRFKRNFKDYMITCMHKTAEYADKVLQVIEKYLHPMLLKISKSYTNLFLFDDNNTMSNYIKKIKEKINENYRLEERVKKVLNKYLDYIVAFYKTGK